MACFVYYHLSSCSSGFTAIKTPLSYSFRGIGRMCFSSETQLGGGLQMHKNSPRQHKKSLSSVHKLPLVPLNAWEERSTAIFVASSPSALAKKKQKPVEIIVRCLAVSVRLWFSLGGTIHYVPAAFTQLLLGTSQFLTVLIWIFAFILESVVSHPWT